MSKLPTNPLLMILLALFVTRPGAWATEAVYSQPVGFQSVKLSEGRNFIGTPLLHDAATLNDVLGTNQLPAGLLESSATTIDLWNHQAQTLTNRYWLSSDPVYPGWRAKNTFAEAGTQSIDQQRGFIVTVRVGQGTQTVRWYGDVPVKKREQVVFGNNAYSLVASPFPSSVSLAESGLAESGFSGGDSRAASDNLLFYNPQNGRFDVVVWYDNTGATGVWRNVDVSPATRRLTPGEGFLIRRRTSSSMTWTSPPPYTISTAP